MAVCLPVVFLLAFATVEISSAIFLKETLSIAAFEGARVGVKRRATNAETVAAAQAVLTARGVTNTTVTVTPSNFSTLRALDPITVQISCPVTNNSAFINDFFTGRTVTSIVRMAREFND